MKSNPKFQLGFFLHGQYHVVSVHDIFLRLMASFLRIKLMIYLF
jgi:hypothetical protein